MKKVFLLLQFFPISAFIIYARRNGFTEEAWALAFQLGGLLAFIETLFLLYRKQMLNRLLLSVNTYLMVGGLAFFLNIEPIQNLYSELREAMVFISTFIVGIITTFFTQGGFIGSPSNNKQMVHKSSFIVLGITAVCFLFSLYFKGDPLLAGTLPFVLLIFSQSFLKKKFKFNISGHQL